MLNPGFVTSKALTGWHDAPAFLPQFRFYEKHRAVIKTASPKKSCLLSLNSIYNRILLYGD